MDGSYGAAVSALRKVEALKQHRGSTVRAATGAVLGWIGAARLRDCFTGDPAAAGFRRLVVAAAELEEAAARLDRCRNPGGARAVAAASERAAVWADVLAQARRLRRILDEERVTATRNGRGAPLA